MLDIVILLTMLLPGMLGGLIRGLVGISKNVLARGEKFRFWRLVFSLIVAIVVGGAASLFVGGDWRIGLLAGYAGSDLIEMLYKKRFFGV